MFMVLPPLTVTHTASAIVAPLGAASGSESVSVGDRLRTAIYSTAHYTPPGDDFVLAQAIVVHRHGDRAPISQSAGSKLRCDASAWAARLVEPPERQRGARVAQRRADLAALNASFPVHGSLGGVGGANDPPFGQLTTKGAAQCVALGASVRKSLEEHAPHLLRGDGLRDRVLVHATAIRRTQLSVQHVLRGLFGPELEREIGTELEPEIGTELKPEIGMELKPEIGLELKPEIDSGAPRRVRAPVHVRPIDDELLLPCPQSCGPLKHRLRQVGATAKRA